MRISPIILIVAAIFLLAWSSPPDEWIAGKVISIQKAYDVCVTTNADGTFKLLHGQLNETKKNKVLHWEMWKAEVNADHLANGATNVVYTIYYEVDWSTNYVTPYGMEAGRTPRQQLSKNHRYSFVCLHLDNEIETNTFQSFDGGIRAE